MVYILIVTYSRDLPDSIVGVYSTYEKAIEAAMEVSPWLDTIIIEEDVK